MATKATIVVTPALSLAIPEQATPRTVSTASPASTTAASPSSTSPMEPPAQKQQQQAVRTPGPSGEIEAVTPVNPFTDEKVNVPPAPPVRQPQQDYWDEKICLEVEYNADLNNPSPVATESPNRDIKSAAMMNGTATLSDGTMRRSSTASVVDPAPAYKTYTQAEIQSMANTYRGEAGVAQEDIPQPADRRIFGYPRKTVMRVAIGIGAVIMLIISISVGVSLATTSRGSAPNAASGLRDSTRIAAMNWTEPNGVAHNSVFWQSPDNSLMSATRDSLSNKWRTVNVTAEVMRTSNAAGLDVLPGTTIASCANGFQQNIYYQNSRRQVQELYTLENNGTGWLTGAFGATINAMPAPGSRISSTRHLCFNCSQSVFVTWQDEEGDIRLGNFTAGVWADGGTIGQAAAPGTALAMSVFTDFRGTGPFGTEANALRVYYTSSDGGMDEWLNGPLNGFVWAQGNFGNAIASNLTTNPSPEIASITYGANGWINNLVSYLDPKGLLWAAVWRGTTWSVQASTVTGLPSDLASSPGGPSFSAIATTQDMRLYGVSKGQIHEFKTSALNPFQWTWEGMVGTK